MRKIIRTPAKGGGKKDQRKRKKENKKKKVHGGRIKQRKRIRM